MSDDQHVELNKNALDIVDSWLDFSKTESSPKEQPQFEKRAQRLGLGAKFVPHKRQEEVGSVLKKKVLREKRRKREQVLENKDSSSESDSEEGLSKASLVKSKAIRQVPLTKQKNT
ncbi:hypothetical protein JH06_1828 [Blastocystis sp. subtype 4]|uniref:hypothetical protein n=1 Tax=Blastocystis sp. subtype 4 TaxID=944170 RepID=UPI000711E818|nr:hypothetical protein JH06_1828 [Blastocystis sp. subtype 4]KNB44576.1 hypothetical protein JH06_1828 [Blastocystis sp. subtype 4]|eukprot:XP_014528017.1 hypothetical protein JH06_1828 [Blastocystis sp. subtype 4]